jgi:hypothetical protein
MTSVATFELETIVVHSAVRDELSKYWHGLGYRVDMCLWWPDNPNHFLCVLEYFYYDDDIESELCMLVAAAKYLLSVAQDNTMYYYRCIDFFSDRDPSKPNYKSGEKLDVLKVDDLRKPEYRPSMSAPEIYINNLSGL